VQNEAYDEEPSEQIHPGRVPVQVELHPSLFADPSSQVSLPSIVPLPQTEGTGVHVSGFVNGLVPRTQVNPTSSLQVEEHPFPDSSSPSSHSSEPSFIPLPHFEQTD